MAAAGFHDLLALCGVTAGGKTRTTAEVEDKGSGRSTRKRRRIREIKELEKQLSADVIAIILSM